MSVCLCSHSGAVQIQTPLLEYTDLFSRSLGDGSDIVMKVRGIKPQYYLLYWWLLS